MKKFFVFKILGGSWSPIQEYNTDNEADANQMRDLLAKTDNKHEYVVMVVTYKGYETES